MSSFGGTSSGGQRGAVDPEIERINQLGLDGKYIEARAAAEVALQEAVVHGPSTKVVLLTRMYVVSSYMLNDHASAVACVDRTAGLLEQTTDITLKVDGLVYLGCELCDILAKLMRPSSGPGQPEAAKQEARPNPRAMIQDTVGLVARLITLLQHEANASQDEQARKGVEALQTRLDFCTLPPEGFLKNTSDTDDPRVVWMRAEIYHARKELALELVELDRCLNLSAAGRWALTDLQRLNLLTIKHELLVTLGRYDEAKALIEDLTTHPVSAEGLSAEERERLDVLRASLARQAQPLQHFVLNEDALATCRILGTLDAETEGVLKLLGQMRLAEALAMAEKAFHDQLAAGVTMKAILLGGFRLSCYLGQDDVDGALAWVDKFVMILEDATSLQLRYAGLHAMATGLCDWLEIDRKEVHGVSPGVHFAWRAPRGPTPEGDKGIHAQKAHIVAAIHRLLSIMRMVPESRLHDVPRALDADELQARLAYWTLSPEQFLESTSATKSPRGRRWRSRVYDNDGQAEKALAEITQALDLDAQGPLHLHPWERVHALMMRCHCLLTLGKRREARGAFDIAARQLASEQLDEAARREAQSNLDALQAALQGQPLEKTFRTLMLQLHDRVQLALTAFSDVQCVGDMIQRSAALEYECDRLLELAREAQDLAMRTRASLWVLEISRLPTWIWRQATHASPVPNLRRASHAARARPIVQAQALPPSAQAVRLTTSGPLTATKSVYSHQHLKIPEGALHWPPSLTEFPSPPEPLWLVVHYAFNGPTLTAYPMLSSEEGKALPYMPCVLGAIRDDLWAACRQLRILAEMGATGRLSQYEFEAKFTDWLHVISETLEFDDLFDFVRNDCKADLSLCIIPDGPLHLIPWPILFDVSGAHLHQVYRDVFTCHSLTVLADQMADSRKPARDAVDVCYFAAPGPVRLVPEERTAESGGIGRDYLTATAQEYSALERVVAPGQLYAFGNAEPPNATIANFRTYHNAAAVTLFSGHGYCRGVEVGLELTDGSVSWGEVLSDPRWDFRGSELVYLNGCFLGQETPSGREVMGLRSTLVRKGAKRVISGLYPLADEAAAEFASLFMKRFVPYLSARKPHPAANAMKEAMSEMSSMSEFSNPYHYGGMFLYGAP